MISISIDDLLSGDNLLDLAMKENNANIKYIYNLFIGIADIFAILLIILPLYPIEINESIYSVNLILYTDFTIHYHWFYYSLDCFINFVGF